MKKEELNIDVYFCEEQDAIIENVIVYNDELDE